MTEGEEYKSVKRNPSSDSTEMTNMYVSILFFITLWVSLQHGSGHPLMKHQNTHDDVRAGKLRTKRCACSSMHDSECYYFCHLDIIWVNTPSKTTLYGLGDAKARRRRSAGRCTCANLCDLICTRFCYQRDVTSRSKKIDCASE
ncbi:endothelin-2 isoform X2 [Syngnathus scovelli]|uniref:endothelin-2 isoform X2 n=1 Tax=Syngnathus scovelli TaxID=161590 RepID=UPI00210FEE58|nr:endothelin-2 isoform X2 [Syngnathus scovelli]